MPCPDCDGTGKEKQQTALPCIDCEVNGQVNCPDHALVTGGGDQQTAREWVQKRLQIMEDDAGNLIKTLTESASIDLVAMHHAQKDRADRAEQTASIWQGRYNDAMRAKTNEMLARRQAEAERDRLMLEIGAWRATVEAREAEVRKLREALEEAQENLWKITNVHWGNDGDCGAHSIAQDTYDVVSAALNQTNTDQ
jgi:hypothetical protein